MQNTARFVWLFVSNQRVGGDRIWRVSRAYSVEMYDTEHMRELNGQFREVTQGLHEMQIQCIAQAALVPHPRSTEYLRHGVARRVSMLQSALVEIFTKFPLETNKPLPRANIAAAQSNLHVFLINLSGVFDNLAWAFVYRHGLMEQIRDPRKIGMFHNRTTRHLPEEINAFLARLTDWQRDYLKNYRDALAHRVPPYIPPAVFRIEDTQRYNELEDAKAECIRNRNWERLDQVWAEQDAVGLPCFYFLHSFAVEEEPRPVFLHPQLITDGKTIVELGRVFFQHWAVTATVPPA